MTLRAKTCFRSKVQNAIQRRILETGCLSRDLRRHELLMDRKLANTREDAGKQSQHTANVIDRIHVGRVESCDHGIEPLLFFGRQRTISTRYVGVGERVVVKRRIAVQVVGRRKIAGVRIRPLLLQRDAEQRRTLDPRPHDLEKLAGLEPLLDVVRQMEVRVVEFIGST